MNSVDEILAKVLEPDDESVRTGTAELKEAMKRPTIFPTLLHIGKHSTSPLIRQYALVLLQKRLSKIYHWEKLTVDFKQGIKFGLLDALTREPDISVRNIAAQVVGSISKHELAERKWPELLEFIQQLCCQENANEKELGWFILSIVADRAIEELKLFLKPFVPIFDSALQDSDTISACYACVVFKKLIPCIGTDEITMIQPLIPKVLIVVRNFIVIDGVKTMTWIAVNLMEIWEELLMRRTAVLAPHLKAVTELCLEIASKKELDDFMRIKARIKALSCIATLVRLEKKSIIENKLVSPILQTLFAVIKEDEKEDLRFPLQALDTLAVIAGMIDEQTFQPFADECLSLTLNLVQSNDYPIFRIRAFKVFASLASVMKEDGAALPVIIPLLVKAIESNEGVTNEDVMAETNDDDDESAFPPLDFLDDDEESMDNEDDDESDVDGYSVENAYLQEKKEAFLALGELALHARYFPLILQLLSDALSRETNPLALDNICAAFTRMIIVNISAVPMDQVFPVLMNYLPLREDFHENSSVLKCFLFLSSNGHPLFASHLPQVMNVILTMATQQELQPEQKPMFNELMAHIASDFPDLYNEWASALPAEVFECSG
ncbi:importin-4-like isoform X2 [Daphnia pulex]|uniref:importin-4-like isoform X2 n=1 Tax=Daphnia pulex TaxID=6669 RepID=UPI001EDD771D|nr:importin-4-like isoform X2 [Daphnia pulex]